MSESESRQVHGSDRGARGVQAWHPPPPTVHAFYRSSVNLYQTMS
jgi:hypothetical protein